MTGRRGAPLTVLLVIGLALAACGSVGDDDAGATSSPSTSASPVTAWDLAGGAFLSDDVDGRSLADDTRVSVAFADGSMSVSAGCNTLFGGYDATGGTLRWTTPPASTRMGCPEALAAQDAWLTDVLTDGVAATLDGKQLVLRSDGVTLTLTRTAG